MMSPLTILLISSVTILPAYCILGIQLPVNLRTAANYVILAQSGITTTGTTFITGNLGLSPAAATAITGFGMTLAGGGTYSTSSLVNGKIYAANYASPTPAQLTQAISDETRAYNDAASRLLPDHLNFGINGPSTLSAGLYKWTSSLALSGSITLSGTSTSVFIFQISGTLNFGSTCKILLSGGVLPSNVVFQVTQAVTLSSGSQIQGIILGKTGIVFQSGATLVKGRALAQTAVTLISNTITSP